MKQIVISAMPEELCMAIVDEENRLVDYMVERPDEEHIANHIFKGTIKNILPGMQAAFLDIGRSDNAYLNLQSGKQSQLLQKLFVGQHLLVQVVKEEMLGKGARVTSDISLAGRFMVLLPYAKGIHISKKIKDPLMREQLAAIAEPYLNKGCGLILRTAASKATSDEVAADMEFLWHTWQSIHNRFSIAKGGTCLYTDADFWYRIFREYVTSDVSTIIVDDSVGFKRISELLALAKLDDCITLQLYRDKEPIYKAYQVDEQIERLTNTEVTLPSGGTLRIDHTEALTVIDVNSSSFVGQSKSAEDLAVAVNTEAAKEICRQLRLRDIGGIIVCDFIDMKQEKHKKDILRVLTRLAKEDKSKTVVCGISSLGLVEMTRKRKRQGLQTILFDTCPQCGGTGYIFSGKTVYLQILRKLRDMYKLGRLKSDIEIECHPDVAIYFTKEVCKKLSIELQKSIFITKSKAMNREAYSLLSIDH